MNLISKFVKNRKNLLVIISCIAILVCSCGLTWALLKTQSGSITNTFKAPSGSITLTEDFTDGVIKKNVNVKNDCDYYVYVRIKLSAYRVNESGDRIGGEAAVPEFTPGTGWLSAGDDMYIYSKPVKPGEKPAADLIGSTGITLKKYTDDDGGVQAVDVIAESIQSNPSDAVKASWDVNVANDGSGTLSLKGGKAQ